MDRSIISSSRNTEYQAPIFCLNNNLPACDLLIIRWQDMTQFSFGSGFGLYSNTPCPLLYDAARTKVTNAGTVRQQMPPLTKRSPEVPSRPDHDKRIQKYCLGHGCANGTPMYTPKGTKKLLGCLHKGHQVEVCPNSWRQSNESTESRRTGARIYRLL